MRIGLTGIVVDAQDMAGRPTTRGPPAPAATPAMRTPPMKRNRFCRVAARVASMMPALLLAAGVMPLAQAGQDPRPVRYRVTELPSLGGSASAASSINNRGWMAGLVDEIQIHLVPVLFGSGTRMFEHLDDHPNWRPLRCSRPAQPPTSVPHRRMTVTSTHPGRSHRCRS
jgi:riboflavin biosynthesis pyrimidine reductase